MKSDLSFVPPTPFLVACVFNVVPKKPLANTRLPFQTVHGVFMARILEWFAIPSKKIMLKILQVRLQQYVNRELPDVQAGFRKGTEEPEIKLPAFIGS